MPAGKMSHYGELRAAAGLHAPKLIGLSHALLQPAGVHISGDRQAVHLDVTQECVCATVTDTAAQQEL